MHNYKTCGLPIDDFEFEQDVEDFENWPYCCCDLEPTEDEDATNQCAACGKPLT